MCDRQHAMFFWSILWYSQSGDDPQEDLTKFGHKLNMKITLKKYPSTIFLARWSDDFSDDFSDGNQMTFLKFWLNFGYWKSQKAHIN